MTDHCKRSTKARLKNTHAIYTPCVSIDEEIANGTHPAVTTIRWNTLIFHLHSGGAGCVLVFSIW